MSLNIKNEETCRLARELALLTGETKTEAITVALRERLEREMRRRSTEERLRSLREISASCASLLDKGSAEVDHGELLYDQYGLPK